MSGYPMRVIELLAGESQQHDRLLGGAASGYNVATEDKLIKTGAGIFYGVVVTVTTSAAVSIRDSLSVGVGAVLMTIPASAPLGSTYTLPVGIIFDTGLFVDFAGTGSLVVLVV